MRIRAVPHVHVSERETAHRWPDGRLDDAAWEDCRWASAVEWVRATGRDVPPTHAEAEALRAASGQGPLGGSTLDQLAAGLRARYRLAPPAWLGKDDLLRALVPGTAAVVDGSLGRFPAGHRLRRWEPAFTGGHSLYVERALDGTWLWCDPLAPTGTQPDRVTSADVATFADGGIVGQVKYIDTEVLPEMFPVVTRQPFPQPVAWHVAAGTTLRGYDPAQPGRVVKQTTFGAPSSAHATARVGVRWVGVDPANAPIPRGAPFLEVSDGVFAGLLIVEAQVTLDPLPDPCAPAVAAARTAALDEAAKAIASLRR